MSARRDGYDSGSRDLRVGAHGDGGATHGRHSLGGPAPRHVGPGGKLVAAAALVVAGVVAGAGLSGAVRLGVAASSAPSSAAASAGGSAPPSPPGSVSPASPGGSGVAPSPSPSPSGGGLADAAFVPVTSFRTGKTSTSASDVSGMASGTSPFASLVLVKSDAAAELRALGLDANSLGSHVVSVPTADALMTTLAKHQTWLGFLRADQVGPGVRALAWGSASLYGEARVADLASWPLHAQLPVDSSAIAYNPADAWTLYAAGDLGLDRGAALAIMTHGNDPSYLYDGGTVKITGHCKDCSEFGWDLPYTRRTGHAGAVRSLIEGADFAIANMEEVAVKNFVFHRHGTVFTGNPAYLAGVRDAGFDWVSMANNHVGDFGPAGVLQSMQYLTQYGLLHGGAGANTTAAHRPSIVTVHGVKVALLSYDTIAPVYNATATKAGSARMTNAWLKHDIAAARRAGAQVVIVWPHWGVEYTAAPTQTQQTLAHDAIDAGADLVIGNHPHWAQAMEVYKGHPIWYALGNFTFDQTWSEPTMEGISLEFTFSGSRLVQVWLHPHLVLDYAQPNLMDPEGSGRVVLDQIFGASKHLPW